MVKGEMPRTLQRAAPASPAASSPSSSGLCLRLPVAGVKPKSGADCTATDIGGGAPSGWASALFSGAALHGAALSGDPTARAGLSSAATHLDGAEV